MCSRVDAARLRARHFLCRPRARIPFRTRWIPARVSYRAPGDSIVAAASAVKVSAVAHSITLTPQIYALAVRLS
jgi:hypothetical protein